MFLRISAAASGDLLRSPFFLTLAAAESAPGIYTGMTPKIVRVMLAGGTRGAGTDDDPVRTVAELFTLDGVPLGEYDPHTGESRIYPEGLQRLGFRQPYVVPLVR